MNRSKNIAALALAVSVSALAVTSASAQNPTFQNGDLVLGFQNPGGAVGGDQQVLVRLGDAATDFRNARDTGTSNYSLANIGSTLTSTFGANWWELSTLYMSVFAANSNSALSTALDADLEPTRTLYVGRARTEVGTRGAFGSTPWTLAGNADMTSGANGIINMTQVLETQSLTTTAVTNSTTGNIDDQNPFLGQNQGTAYGVFPGGVQFQFGTGAFGALPEIGSVEGVLDLQRMQARNDRPGQYGFGQPIREGSFLGTISIDQDGDVAFQTAPVPEPSSALLLVGAMFAGAIRRRRVVAA